MSTTGKRRGVNSSKSPVATVAPPDASKLEMIRSGKKKKTITGFKENKNITLVHDGGKVIAVEKEKKFEEAGVTRKKRNFIMFESKLGTEKETDLMKIAGQKKREPKPRVEEKIIQTRKRKEYLDNYQYHETKQFRSPNPKPSLVVHQRLGDKIGGSYEETTYEKFRTFSPPPKQTKAQPYSPKQTTYSRNPRSNAPLNKNYNTSTTTRQTKQTRTTTSSNTYKTKSPQQRATTSSTTRTTTTKNYNIRTMPRNNRPTKKEDGNAEYKETHTKIVTKDGQTKTTTQVRTRKGK